MKYTVARGPFSYLNRIGKEIFLYPIMEDGKTIAYTRTRLGALVIAAKLNSHNEAGLNGL